MPHTMNRIRFGRDGIYKSSCTMIFLAYLRLIAAKIYFFEKGESHGEQRLPWPLNEPIDRATVHQTKEQKQNARMRERKWDLLEGPKGRYGWGYHPYTLLTAILFTWFRLPSSRY